MVFDVNFCVCVVNECTEGRRTVYRRLHVVLQLHKRNSDVFYFSVYLQYVVTDHFVQKM